MGEGCRVRRRCQTERKLRGDLEYRHTQRLPHRRDGYGAEGAGIMEPGERSEVRAFLCVDILDAHYATRVVDRMWGISEPAIAKLAHAVSLDRQCLFHLGSFPAQSSDSPVARKAPRSAPPHVSPR